MGILYQSVKQYTDKGTNLLFSPFFIPFRLKSKEFHESLGFLNPCRYLHLTPFFKVALGFAQIRKTLATKDVSFPRHDFLARHFPSSPPVSYSIFSNQMAFAKRVPQKDLLFFNRISINSSLSVVARHKRMWVPYREGRTGGLLKPLVQHLHVLRQQRTPTAPSAAHKSLGL